MLQVLYMFKEFKIGSILALLLAVASGLASFAQVAQHSSAPLPTLVHIDGHSALMVDGAPYLMLGAQIHNSSSWPAAMPAVWAAIEGMKANTMEAPVYWETMEPEQGRFDFSQVDMLIDQSREHGVRLVLLWFGTWKNGSGHYIPQWMKQDEAKYPHLTGENGRALDSLSPHAPATLAADKRAFSRLMQHLKANDPQRTVIMVQVENETGVYGAVRDHSPVAEALFQKDVPQAVLKGMGKEQGGSWTKVFGQEAAGFFQSWAVATYVNEVAQAGKAEYALPMYVNAALRDPLHFGRQGTWESGGPTDDVLPIWKAAAPAIDILAPDIYHSDHARYAKVLDLYATEDNALLVPETGSQADYARFCFSAIGHGALGWAPFGVDQADGSFAGAAELSARESARQQFTYNFELLRPIDRLIARLNFEGKVKGSAEDESVHAESFNFGEWTALISYGLPGFGMGKAPQGNQTPRGEALVAQLGPGDFLVAGYAARIDFQAAGNSAGQQRQFLAVEEGTYVAGKWTRTRILNGDETDYGLNFTTNPRLLRVTLATF
jgi:beta-galactosidase GanA